LKTIESTYDYADHLDMCSDHPCTHKTQVNEQLLKLLKEIKSCGTGEKPDHEIVCEHMQHLIIFLFMSSSLYLPGEGEGEGGERKGGGCLLL